MVDLALIGIIAGFVIGGFRTGFVRRLASLGFLAVAFVVAANLSEPAAGLIETLVPSMQEGYSGLIGFAAVFGLAFVGLNLAARPVLSRIAVSGLSRTADQALGAGLGIIEGALLASVAIVIVTTYASDELVGGFTDLGLLPDLAVALEGSIIARFLMATTVPFVVLVLGPLLPPDVKSVIELLPASD